MATRLLQIHHQNKANPNETALCAQKGIDTHAQYDEWMADIKTRFPLPDGYVFMVCNEQSIHFVKAVDKEPADASTD